MPVKILINIFLCTFFLSIISCERSAACNYVTGLHATSITQSSAVLNWDATVCDSFLIRYYTPGTNDVHFISVNNGSDTSVVVDSLYPNTTYHWLIHTYCNGGMPGPYQLAPDTFITLNGIVTCLPPNLLETRNITNTSANVTWSYFVEADSFLVRYHPSGSANFTWKYIAGNFHSVTLSNLSPSTIFEWSVRSVCNGNIQPTIFTDTFVTNCDTLPVPDHIVICIMENKGYSQIIDSIAIAPYINALAVNPMSALFTQSYGIEHPSQPNYLDLFSGKNQGVSNNLMPSHHFTTPNLASELFAAGKTFVSYSQSLPYTGSDTIRSGNYERKHNPLANWVGTSTNQVPDSCNKSFADFPVDFNDLPTVSYVVPDQAYDMHNGTISKGDSFLAENLDAYIQWAMTNNSLFILTFDEDNHAYNNRIVTIFTGPMVKGGQYSKYMNHYSVLRTIEDMYATGHAGHASAVESVRECWLNQFTSVAEAKESIDWAVYGYAGTGELNIDYSLTADAAVTIEVFTQDGKRILIQPVSRQQQGIHRAIITPRHHMSDGFYIVRLQVDDKMFSKKTVLVY